MIMTPIKKVIWQSVGKGTYNILMYVATNLKLGPGKA